MDSRPKRNIDSVPRWRGRDSRKRLSGTVMDCTPGSICITYIVSSLPRYRPARRTASIPIRPCPRDCARGPGNAPRRCFALSACRLSPELAASRKASLGTRESNWRVALKRKLKWQRRTRSNLSSLELPIRTYRTPLINFSLLELLLMSRNFFLLFLDYLRSTRI